MTKRMESAGATLFAEAKASGTVPTTAEGLEQLEKQLGAVAMLDGINLAFFVSTIVAVVALILTFFIKRVIPPKSEKAFDKPAN